MADSLGNSNAILENGFAREVPGVDYTTIGQNAVAVSMPSDRSYTLTFRTTVDSTTVELIKGLDDTSPSQATRYVDLILPENVTVMLQITPDGAGDLRYDGDGDGTFETVVTPTASVSGAAARDVTPPSVGISETRVGSNSQITISASDAESGVKSVLYSLDGSNYQPYIQALLLDPVRYRFVYAFADDNVGNRSDLAVHRLKAESRLAFTSERDGNSEIYLVNDDGSGQTNLTNNPGYDDSPRWSPDRSQIAFESDRDGTNDIYVMGADGSNPRRVTSVAGDNYDPQWSPDSSRIAFQSSQGGNNEIYVVNADGSNPVRLTDNSAYDYLRGWSPDSTKIVFESDRDGNVEIYVTDSDGLNQRRLTTNTSEDRSPAWSPDGARIAYSNRGSGGRSEIYVMNADGSNPARLTYVTGPADDLSPSWSPDGAMLAFKRSVFEAPSLNQYLYAMNADGTDLRQLCRSSFNNSPAWSPDGARIAVSGSTNGNDDIYVVNSNGTGLARLTNAAESDYSPSWEPLPPAVDLAIGKSHAGDFTAGATGLYTLAVTNIGFEASAGAITVTDTLPPGLTFLSGGGAGWACSASGQVVTCTHGGSLGAGASTSIPLSVSVAGDAAPSVINSARVSHPDDANPANNTASDVATVNTLTLSGRVTGAGGAGIPNVTVSLSGPQAGTTTTDGNGAYSFVGLPAGHNYVVRPSAGGYAFSPASRTFDYLSGNQTADFTGFQPTVVNAGGVLISEFRFRGPAGAAGGAGSLDEFVELYNNTGATITVGAPDGSEGWSVVAADGIVRFIVPNGTVIPASGHYLGVNASDPGGYSLSGHASPDTSYNLDIADDSGLALFKTAEPSNFTAANRLDAVGFSDPSGAVTDLYREGPGLAPIGANDGQYTFARKQAGASMTAAGTPQDTNDNAADWHFLATDAGIYGGVQSKLGAPGPQNLTSPIGNTNIYVNRLDYTVAVSSPPNRARRACSDPLVEECNPSRSALGTMSFRRRVINNTGATISRLRFRITLTNTAPSPVGTADLRAITSGDIMVNGVFVRGTTLEEPPTQALGGGWNSAWTIALPTPLPPGADFNVQMLVGVQQGGTYSLLISTEVLP